MVSEPCRHASRAVLAPACFNDVWPPGVCYDAFMNIRYSPLSDSDASRFSQELRPGQVGTSSSGGIFVAHREDIFALADDLAEEELLQEMSSYGKRTTGIDNTIWISPRGNTRHAARLKVAIDPPHAVKPSGKDATVAINDGSLVQGDMPASLLKQVQQFVKLNRDVLLEYWNYEITTDEMEQRLKKV